MGASPEGEAIAFTRYAKADIEDLVKNRFKTEFLKEKCAECGCMATKRFKGTMSVIVAQMLDSFWCNECGRVLCESHRYQHTCERLDEQKERNKNISREALAAQMAEAERLKEAAEEEKRATARAAAALAEKERLIRKGKREVIAKKARVVEDFLMQFTRPAAVDGTTQVHGARVRDELFELYSRAKRIALTLYNEFEHPTSPELPEQDWEDVKDIYERAKELTHMFAAVEGQPLDMHNPWDPPPPPEELGRTAALDGAGLGRGLL
mmetsp:Transcript_40476/g.116342  ORF Transcript_40476/g.116342 Transcript_40476/m.116342 type:complete len:266 (+) Transcript_40476:124-921(+)